MNFCAQYLVKHFASVCMQFFFLLGSTGRMLRFLQCYFDLFQIQHISSMIVGKCNASGCPLFDFPRQRKMEWPLNDRLGVT